MLDLFLANKFQHCHLRKQHRENCGDLRQWMKMKYMKYLTEKGVLIKKIFHKLV